MKKTIYQSLYGTAVYGTDRYGSFIFDTIKNYFKKLFMRNVLAKEDIVVKFYKKEKPIISTEKRTVKFYKNKINNIFGV